MRLSLAAAALLTVRVCVAPTSEGSVWWEWWGRTGEPNAHAKCLESDVSESTHHQDWTYDSECLHSHALREDDPVSSVVKLFEQRVDLDVDIHCLSEQEALLMTGNASTAVIRVYNSTDKSCTGQLFNYTLLQDSCGNVLFGLEPDAAAQTELNRLKIHCSTCNWYFLGESAPPYTLQTVGVTLFLIGCIFVNFLIQDKLDLLLKILPVWLEKNLPCVRPPDFSDREGLMPGVLVSVVSAKGFWCDPEGAVQDGPDVPEEWHQSADLRNAHVVMSRLAVGRENQDSDAGQSPPVSPLRHGRVSSFRAKSRSESFWTNAKGRPLSDDVWEPLCIGEETSPVGLATPVGFERTKTSNSSTVVAQSPRALGRRAWLPDDEHQRAPTLQAPPGADQRRVRKRPQKEDGARPSAIGIAIIDSWSRQPNPAAHPSRDSLPVHHAASYRSTRSLRHGSSFGGFGETYPKRGSRPSPRSGRLSPSSSATEAGTRSSPSYQLSPLLSPPLPSVTAPPARDSARSPTADSDDLVPASTRRPLLPLSQRVGSTSPRLPVPPRRVTAEFGSGLFVPDPSRPRHGTPPKRHRDDFAASALAELSGAVGNHDALSRRERRSRAASTVTWGDESVHRYGEHHAPPSAEAGLVDVYREHGSKRKDKAGEAFLGGFNITGIHPMCIVCGRKDRTPVKHKSGYKCLKFCEGKPHDRTLQLHAWSCGSEDPALREAALRGCFGKTACVIGRSGVDERDWVLLAFRKPRCWLRTAVVAQVRSFPMVLDVDAVHPSLSEWPVRVVEPQSLLERVWVRLLEAAGSFSVAHQITEGQQQGWSAIQLGAPAAGMGTFAVWLEASQVSKVGDWGGEFARLCEKHEMKQRCQMNATPLTVTPWMEWWGDFQLNVGNVQRFVYPDEYSRGNQALVSFAQHATFLIPVECLRPATAKQADAEYLVVPQPVQLRAMMAVFVASTPPLLAGKAIVLIIIFVLSIFEAVSDGHSGSANNHNAWEAYEEVYFKLFNSGYPTLLADCGTVTAYFYINFRPSFRQFANGVGVPILIILSIALGISLPGLFTHAVPMIFYYLWVWAPFLGLVFLTSRLIWRNRPRPPSISPNLQYDMKAYLRAHTAALVKSSLTFLFFRVLAEVLVVIFLQTNYNYAVLTYANRNTYTGVLGQEFRARTLSCVLENTKKIASIVL